MIDMRCVDCEKVHEDVLLRENVEIPRCSNCGGALERVLLGHSGYVHGDDIPGGIWIKNGICNPDGTPRRYDSKSEMRREAKARGLVTMVKHEGGRGHDKSCHTQRFI